MYQLTHEYQRQYQRPPIYVDADATGANDGTSWADAFKYLQDALYKPPTSGDEIWVAAGTYKPDANSANPSGTGEREATFQLISGVAIYGGFAGGESSLDERDWTSNVTILSGDINTPGDNSDNSYHVVTGSGTDATAVLDGFSITAGNADGSISYRYGGGMYNYDGSPTLTNCTFSGNSAAVYGGGMYNEKSSPTVTNCTFSTNSAEYEGGGMYNEKSSPTVTYCTFSFNAVGDYGGGMENYDNSYPTVSDCNFIGNWADYFGGGMENWDDSNATVINCKFINNYTYDYGGGMDNGECNPTVINCTFIGNEGDYGGGMYNYDGSPTVTNCTFSGNSAVAYGGGMYNDNSSPTVTNCTFSGNSAEGDGAGMENYPSSSPTVTNCTFTGNSAGGYGGGMDNWDNSNPTVTNCTFSGNSAYEGGGMENYNKSNPTVTNCTFSGNSADYEGGGMYNGNSSPMVTNCILWANGGAQIYHTGSGSTTVSYCDVQGGWSGTGNINADPLFIDPNGLDGIGGTADDNLRLSAGSPCIDVGDNNSVPADTADLDGDGNTVEPIPWDLDGRDRFVDGDCNDTEIVDMGAYEFAYAYIGDFDGECDVGFEDFAILALAWLTEPGETGWNPACDISVPADNSIDMLDLAVLGDNWLAGVK